MKKSIFVLSLIVLSLFIFTGIGYGQFENPLFPDE